MRRSCSGLQRRGAAIAAARSIEATTHASLVEGCGRRRRTRSVAGSVFAAAVKDAATERLRRRCDGPVCVFRSWVRCSRLPPTPGSSKAASRSSRHARGATPSCPPSRRIFKPAVSRRIMRQSAPIGFRTARAPPSMRRPLTSLWQPGSSSGRRGTGARSARFVRCARQETRRDHPPRSSRSPNGAQAFRLPRCRRSTLAACVTTDAPLHCVREV
jgi:hypothetical protein